MTAESDCLKSNGSVVSGRMATGGGVVDGEGVVGASGQWNTPRKQVHRDGHRHEHTKTKDKAKQNINTNGT